MRNSRMHLAGQAGFTLTEILVVVVLVGMASAIVAFAFQRLLISNKTLERRQERSQEARDALAVFAADVRAAKAVLAAKPEKISLWAADSDSDGVSSLAELVNYTFVRDYGQTAAPWMRETWNSRTEMLSLADLRVAADTVPPGIRHVVIHLAVGNATSDGGSDSQWIGTSILKREEYRAPAQ